MRGLSAEGGNRRAKSDLAKVDKPSQNGAMKKPWILFALILAPALSMAETSLSESAQQVVGGVKQAYESSVERAVQSRAEQRYFGGLLWAPIDLPVPSKIGGHVGYYKNANKSYELEYLRGSFAIPFLIEDLGSIVDERLSLRARTFYGGTFNVFYGFDYMRFRVKLGNDILDLISPNTVPNVDLLDLQSVGAHFGVGNRWALGNRGYIGVDWFSWTQPLVQTYRKAPILGTAADEDDKDDVRAAILIIQYFPRMTLLRVGAGLTF